MGSLQQIEIELLNEATVCTDATVVTVNGKQAYIRNSSSNTAVLYHAMEQKSIYFTLMILILFARKIILYTLRSVSFYVYFYNRSS